MEAPLVEKNKANHTLLAELQLHILRVIMIQVTILIAVTITGCVSSPTSQPEAIIPPLPLKPLSAPHIDSIIADRTPGELEVFGRMDTNTVHIYMGDSELTINKKLSDRIVCNLPFSGPTSTGIVYISDTNGLSNRRYLTLIKFSIRGYFDYGPNHYDSTSMYCSRFDAQNSTPIRSGCPITIFEGNFLDTVFRIPTDISTTYKSCYSYADSSIANVLREGFYVNNNIYKPPLKLDSTFKIIHYKMDESTPRLSQHITVNPIATYFPPQ